MRRILLKTEKRSRGAGARGRGAGGRAYGREGQGAQRMSPLEAKGVQGSQELSRFARLAESNGPDRRLLRDRGSVPEARGVRSLEPVAACGRLRAANIAEGHGRRHTGEFLNHLSIAYGSLMEVETHLHIAHRLGYVTTEGLDSLLHQTAEVGRLLNGLMRSLARKRRARSPEAPVLRSPTPGP